MAENLEVRQMWGTDFHVVENGLSEDEVTAYVNNLMEEAQKTKTENERQSSLLKLAEQTVVEADKLAKSIESEAHQAAAAETARIVGEAETEAKKQADRLLKKGERDAEDKISRISAEAEQSANEVIEKAKKDGQDIVDGAKEKVASMESEAKLEAEYIVRRFAMKFVEEIRNSVTEATNNMLPNLESFVSEAAAESTLRGKDDTAPAIPEPARKQRASSRR